MNEKAIEKPYTRIKAAMTEINGTFSDSAFYRSVHLIKNMMDEINENAERRKRSNSKQDPVNPKDNFTE